MTANVPGGSDGSEFSLDPQLMVAGDLAIEQALLELDMESHEGNKAKVEAGQVSDQNDNELEIIHPKRLTDDLFRTVRAVRAAIQNAGYTDHDILIPLEDELLASETGTNLGVPRSLLVALISSARVALRWEKTQVDPVGAGIGFAEKMLQKMPDDAISLEELQASDQIFEGLEPVRSKQSLLESLESALESIPVEPQAPDQQRERFYIEKCSGSTESTHIAAIIRAMLNRTMDLYTVYGMNSVDGPKAELAAWTKWKEKVIAPSQSDAQSMFKIYREVMVPTGDLLALSAIASASRSAADKIAKCGGFLHPPKLRDIQSMLRSGCKTFVVRGDSGLLGYTSVLTETDLVKTTLQDMFGYNPRATTAYTKGTLPKKNISGNKVEWLGKQFAVDVLNSADYLATSIEVAVLPNKSEQQRRTTGIATALKYRAYQEALKEGKTSVLVRFFEIIEVNGKPMNSIVENNVSKHFILSLGGQPVGSYEDIFDADSGVKMKVKWHVWVCDLKKAVETIERPNR